MASTTTKIRIVTLPGDGIGREIIPPALHILDMVRSSLGCFMLEVQERLDMGAQYYGRRSDARSSRCIAVPDTSRFIAQHVTIGGPFPCPSARRSHCLLGSISPAFASSLLNPFLDHSIFPISFDNAARIADRRGMCRRGYCGNGRHRRHQGAGDDERASSER